MYWGITSLLIWQRAFIQSLPVAIITWGMVAIMQCAFLRHAHVLKSVWHAYGWRALDQYALLTGGYPRWATFDTWPNPVAWGAPDGIDTRFWFSGGRSAHLFGQESIFDVAKGFGMQTDVVASSDYILSDATTRNLDLLQRSSTFDAVRWLSQME